VTNYFYHRKRENKHTGIRGRGEQGRPVREGRLAVASGGATGHVAAALVVAVIEEGDGRGGKRGGHETRNRYCLLKDLATGAERLGRRGRTRSGV
jgi:hypothetical protein